MLVFKHATLKLISLPPNGILRELLLFTHLALLGKISQGFISELILLNQAYTPTVALVSNDM